MGNCDIKPENIENQKKCAISLSDLKLYYPIGKGGFGRVWKVSFKNKKYDPKFFNNQINYKNNLNSQIIIKEKKTSISTNDLNNSYSHDNLDNSNESNKNINFYALKEMNKSKIYLKKSCESVLNERKFFSKIHSKFLVNMYYAFQTNDSLYLLLDYYNGGDLRYFFQKKKKFNNFEIKFIVTNILFSLNVLHKNGIIHRDLKPENLLFDNKGYLHLTDYGVSAEIQSNCKRYSGTLSYMAPEVILKKIQDFTVDFFSLGVITYELLFNIRPYIAENKKELKELILNKKINIKAIDIPLTIDKNICDFINLLLNRKKNKRLGYFGGIKEIFRHPFLSDFECIDNIKKKNIESPFNINYSDNNFDPKNANKKDEIFYDLQKYIDLCNNTKLFINFDYNFFDNESNLLDNSIIDDSELEKEDNIEINIYRKNKNYFNVKKNNKNSIKIQKKNIKKNIDFSTREISPFSYLNNKISEENENE
jgi:serine/threonine protein kinase